MAGAQVVDAGPGWEARPSLRARRRGSRTMEDPQPLPQPELPLCDSLIIWVSVIRARRARPPAGRAERGNLRLPRPPVPQPVRDRALHPATAPHGAQVARRRGPPRFPACCPFGPAQHPRCRHGCREMREIFFFFFFSVPPLSFLIPFLF